MDCLVLAAAEDIHLQANYRGRVIAADHISQTCSAESHDVYMDDALFGSGPLPDQSAQIEYQELYLDYEDCIMSRDADLAAEINSLYEPGSMVPPDPDPGPFSCEIPRLEPGSTFESDSDSELEEIIAPAQTTGHNASESASSAPKNKPKSMNKMRIKPKLTRKHARAQNASNTPKGAHKATKRKYKQRITSAVAPTVKNDLPTGPKPASKFALKPVPKPSSNAPLKIILRPISNLVFNAASESPIKTERLVRPTHLRTPAPNPEWSPAADPPLRRKKRGQGWHESAVICNVDGCTHRSGTPQDCQRHRLTHYAPQLVCPGCSEAFRRADSLKRHLTGIDGHRKTGSCYLIAVERYGPETGGNWRNMNAFRVQPGSEGEETGERSTKRKAGKRDTSMMAAIIEGKEYYEAARKGRPLETNDENSWYD
ncbi:hypothetical protein PUNSTDRAFT_134707 [Punctularia strigosozonata HHB-11173 SS5]|uniref:uncharacterized protein n=1 Tax=Punctularia strigosozonata (strain HHB-11173) TaxID=741275 RepID=UPI000441771A|nr:uncharacterized protein PUNSTDRAFT_134707 [Punctularia strigosozonata HHB-11173 SS5]EIN08315.1 hypothetical protein PUNSTDRAFT_134707 [Punctularia strigosozonata HHB-11173 SS5]